MPLAIYKKKQGLWVRWGSFICLALLLLFGAYRCYGVFPDWDWAIREFAPSYLVPLVDIELPAVTPKLLISVFLGLLLLGISAYLCFIQQRISEFLIDTESEMRKVSWPTYREVVKSSIVVIIAIIILAVYLYGVDIILANLFQVFFF